MLGSCHKNTKNEKRELENEKKKLEEEEGWGKGRTRVVTE